MNEKDKSSIIKRLESRRGKKLYHSNYYISARNKRMSSKKIRILSVLNGKWATGRLIRSVLM